MSLDNVILAPTKKEVVWMNFVAEIVYEISLVNVTHDMYRHMYSNLVVICVLGQHHVVPHQNEGDLMKFADFFHLKLLFFFLLTTPMTLT